MKKYMKGTKVAIAAMGVCIFCTSDSNIAGVNVHTA